MTVLINQRGHIVPLTEDEFAALATRKFGATLWSGLANASRHILEAELSHDSKAKNLNRDFNLLLRSALDGLKAGDPLTKQLDLPSYAKYAALVEAFNAEVEDAPLASQPAPAPEPEVDKDDDAEDDDEDDESSESESESESATTDPSAVSSDDIAAKVLTGLNRLLPKDNEGNVTEAAAKSELDKLIQRVDALEAGNNSSTTATPRSTVAARFSVFTDRARRSSERTSIIRKVLSWFAVTVLALMGVFGFAGYITGIGPVAIVATWAWLIVLVAFAVAGKRAFDLTNAAAPAVAGGGEEV